MLSLPHLVPVLESSEADVREVAFPQHLELVLPYSK